MMELTASQPVLINRGMLYLDWNLGDPTPWGHHLAPTSRLSSSSSPRLLSAGQPPCIYLRAHTAPYASSTRATFVTEAFSCTRPRTRPADAAFIPMLDSLVASVPSIFTWWLMFMIDVCDWSFQTADDRSAIRIRRCDFSSNVTRRN